MESSAIIWLRTFVMEEWIMRELILSKDVRNYIEEKNWQFSVVEQATLIYQSEVSIPKIHKILSELMSKTDNGVFANQIRERILWDDSCIGNIQNLTEGFVFHLQVWEEEDAKEIITIDVYGDNRGIIADGVPEISDFMDEVLPKQEHQEKFRESLWDIVRYKPVPATGKIINVTVQTRHSQSIADAFGRSLRRSPSLRNYFCS